MLTTLRNSATIQILPRMGLSIFGFYHIPFVRWRGDELDWWIIGIAGGLTVFAFAIDGARWTRWREQQRCARFWAELHRRHAGRGWEENGNE